MSIKLVPLGSQIKIQRVRENAVFLCAHLSLLIAHQQLYYVSTIFLMIGLGLSKLSVVFFLLRLSPARRHKLVFYGVAGVVAAWTVASIFTLALQCNISHPWITVGERCTGVVGYGTITGLFRDNNWLTLSGVAVPEMASHFCIRHSHRDRLRCCNYLPRLGSPNLPIKESHRGRRLCTPPSVRLPS
jgi:hypothetical protein